MDLKAAMDFTGGKRGNGDSIDLLNPFILCSLRSLM
jgi:hypothetical protein